MTQKIENEIVRIANGSIDYKYYDRRARYLRGESVWRSMFKMWNSIKRNTTHE